MSNVVIMVWMKNLDAGFGDLLRGTIYLHKLSQQMKFNLIVDTQLHPVSQFLISRPHEHSKYVIQNESKIIHAINPPADFIVNQLRDHALSRDPNPILITTNHSDNHNESPSVESKQFMCSILLPNDEFKKYFNEMRNAFKIPKYYSIIHFRLGDYDIIRHRSNSMYYNELFDIINENMMTSPNLHILTDSVLFKQYLKNRLHPKIINRLIPTTPVHLSYPNSDIAIKETLFDFMLLTNAQFIKTHSVYGWISGFVQWASHIFSVPLINIKPKIKPMNFNNLNPMDPADPAPMQLMKPPMQLMKPPMQSTQPMSSLMAQIRTNFSPKSHSIKLRF